MSSTQRTAEVPGTGRSVPLGVLLIVAVGGIGAVLDLFGGLGFLGAGVAGLFGGTLQIALAALKLFVLFNFLRLKWWAWTVTLVVFGLDTLLSLFTLDIVGALFAGVLAAYVYSVRTHFG